MQENLAPRPMRRKYVFILVAKIGKDGRCCALKCGVADCTPFKHFSEILYYFIDWVVRGDPRPIAVSAKSALQLGHLAPARKPCQPDPPWHHLPPLAFRRQPA